MTPPVAMALAFLFASGSVLTSTVPLLRSRRLLMESKPIARPASTASFASSASAASDDVEKPRILCLHGKFQSGAIFSNKIAGARRKIAREYELDFVDGPILLPQDEGADDDENLAPRAWWNRSDEGKHTLVREAFDYVIERAERERYDAIIAFSQGGTLATALVSSGALPNVRALLTAGAPYVQDAFEIAAELSKDSTINGLDVPKLHLAGETDSMVPVESTRELCERGGNGELIVHDQGHLFPTRSARVKEMLDFLRTALAE